VHVHVQTDPEYDNNGLRLEGDKGWLFVNRERIEGSAVESMSQHRLCWLLRRLEPGAGWKANVLVHHLRQFCACVRWGEQPVADVASMHRSATACHLANISLRLGRKLRWDAARERAVDDTEANAMLSRPQRAPYGLTG
jgi:hypothetical protein